MNIPGIEPQPFGPAPSGFNPPAVRTQRTPPVINPHLLAFVAGLLGMVTLLLALVANLIWPYLAL